MSLKITQFHVKHSCIKLDFQGVVIDNNDGTYCISYIPKVRGTHQIEVTIRGKHIKGSPFEIMVRSVINLIIVNTTIMQL